jgi:hypothetical protein
MSVEALARNLALGSLLTDLKTSFGGYEVTTTGSEASFITTSSSA